LKKLVTFLFIFSLVVGATLIIGCDATEDVQAEDIREQIEETLNTIEEEIEAIEIEEDIEDIRVEVEERLELIEKQMEDIRMEEIDEDVVQRMESIERRIDAIRKR
jgi:TolA-binding protein